MWETPLIRVYHISDKFTQISGWDYIKIKNVRRSA